MVYGRYNYTYWGFINQLTTGGHHHVGRSTNGGSSRIVMLRLSSPDGENIAVLCQINGANVTWTARVFCSDPLFFIGQIQDVFQYFSLISVSLFLEDPPWGKDSAGSIPTGSCRLICLLFLATNMHLLTGAFYVGNGWVAGGCWDDY